MIRREYLESMSQDDLEMVAHRKGNIEMSLPRAKESCFDLVNKDALSPNDIMDCIEDSLIIACPANLGKQRYAYCGDANEQHGKFLCDPSQVIKATLDKKSDYRLTCDDCVKGGFCTLHNMFWYEMMKKLYENR